jgi:hypothetical protein
VTWKFSYSDLHNLPDIIVRCVRKGISFSEREIINKYYEQAFSVRHYQAMEKCKEVNPEEYEEFNQNLLKVIIHEYKGTVRVY